MLSFNALSLEKLAEATIKNRAEYMQLRVDKNRLTREKRKELRVINNEIERFKAKYARRHSCVITDHATAVKMYETHVPGFCFKRNGEHRTQQAVSPENKINFESLQFLLFTDGEIDIDKVICLHLLSSHETQNISPPSRNISILMKKDSPLEQLIERSKEQPSAAVTSNLLPTYILDDHKANSKKFLNDERLISRLLVNEKIRELIMTVITALENSNPEKVKQLITLSEDTSALKRIFRKEHIQDYIRQLKEHSLLSSCSSFILTQADKSKASHIEIRTPNGVLENLVRYIRATILQFAGQSSICNEKRMSELDLLQTKFSTRIKKLRTFIKNKDRLAKNSGEEKLHSLEKVSSSEFKEGVLSNLPHPESNQLKENIERTASTDVKINLKQITCPACMEKWKIPLPNPKVPKNVRRYLKCSQKPATSSCSSQRMSILIEQERYTLESYDRRYSDKSTNSNRVSQLKQSPQSDSIDIIKLNVFDLEKIRQEIRDKEAKKKLQKFLCQ